MKMLFWTKLWDDLLGYTHNYLPPDNLIPPESHERVAFHAGYVRYREVFFSS